MAFLPFFPLKSGLLTGKYRKGQPIPHDTRVAKYERYRKLLRAGFREQAVPRASNHSVFAIRLDTPAVRDRIHAALSDRGFETKVYYDPLAVGLPNTDYIYNRLLALPTYPQMMGKVRQICDIINRAARGRGVGDKRAR